LKNPYQGINTPTLRKLYNNYLLSQKQIDKQISILMDSLATVKKMAAKVEAELKDREERMVP
jgi:hypothetical protein